VGHFLVVNKLRSSARMCPLCGSQNSRRAKRAELEESPRFQVLASRKCLACGHVWEPDASRWLLLLGIVMGSLFTVFGVAVIVGGDGWHGSIAVLLGTTTFLGCVRRWRQKRTQLPDKTNRQ
jgi:hypothetical protein